MLLFLGCCVFLQVVDPDSFKGPIRLRLTQKASQHAASKAGSGSAQPVEKAAADTVDKPDV
jgi:hypothetical protein